LVRLTELVGRAIKGMGGLDISSATPAGYRPALCGRFGTALTREKVAAFRLASMRQNAMIPLQALDILG
jgi:hypothetical protein